MPCDVSISLIRNGNIIEAIITDQNVSCKVQRLRHERDFQENVHMRSVYVLFRTELDNLRSIQRVVIDTVRSAFVERGWRVGCVDGDGWDVMCFEIWGKGPEPSELDFQLVLLDPSEEDCGVDEKVLFPVLKGEVRATWSDYESGDLDTGDLEDFALEMTELADEVHARMDPALKALRPATLAVKELLGVDSELCKVTDESVYFMFEGPGDWTVSTRINKGQVVFQACRGEKVRQFKSAAALLSALGAGRAAGASAGASG